jgi:hypothetical protein
MRSNWLTRLSGLGILGAALASCSHPAGAPVPDFVAGNTAGLVGYQVVGNYVVWIDKAGAHASMSDGSGTTMDLGPAANWGPPVGASGNDAVFSCPATTGSTCAPLVADLSPQSSPTLRMLAAMPTGGPWVVGGGNLFVGESGAGGAVLWEALDGTGTVQTVQVATGTNIAALLISGDAQTLLAAAPETDGDHVLSFPPSGQPITDLATLPAASTNAPVLLAAANLGQSTARIAAVVGGHTLFDVPTAAGGQLTQLYQAPGQIAALAVAGDRAIAWSEQSSAGEAFVRAWVDSSNLPQVLAQMAMPPTTLPVSRNYMFWIEPSSSGAQVVISTPSQQFARVLGQVGGGQQLSLLETDPTYLYVMVAPTSSGTNWIGRLWYGSL